MARTVIPMIHVPDVRATATWYTDLGFTVLAIHPGHDDPDWAMLAFGEGRIMLNAGGRPSAAERREVDLYVYAEDVPALARRLAARVEVIETVHETEYGMRGLIIRDLNGFWVTFGEEVSRP